MLSRWYLTKTWSRSKLSHNALINAHPWGFPVYALQNWLQDGGKIPKWEPWYIRGQYRGVSPLRARTSGSICNINKNCMSPQFYVVYDNHFQTFHSSEGKTPAKCPYLIVFYCFLSNSDDSDVVPELADEWLTSVDIAQRQEVELNHRNQTAYHDEATHQGVPEDYLAHRAPPQDGTAPQREPHDAPAQDGTTSHQRAPPQVKDLPFMDSLQDDPPDIFQLPDESPDTNLHYALL